MTDEELIKLIRSSPWSNVFLERPHILSKTADRLEALVKERDALKVSYEDIYADAMADAESDARDFETDLWKLVRQYITELGFDWSGDASLDGVTADEALQHIRECMDGETARAERLEAALRLLHDNLVLAFPTLADLGPVANARAALKGDDHE